MKNDENNGDEVPIHKKSKIGVVEGTAQLKKPLELNNLEEFKRSFSKISETQIKTAFHECKKWVSAIFPKF